MLVLDQLGVQSVAVAIGGSMGGMAVLEWALCTPKGYVKNIVPIATSSRHSAWCISWGEAQRQSIYSDPLYLDGYYDVASGQPKTGLAAARMAALLTYRSRDSFESRFGRKIHPAATGIITPPPSSSGLADHALAVHNDGHKGGHRFSRYSTSSPSSSTPPSPPSNSGSLPEAPSRTFTSPAVFSAQNYLRYQGDKFTARFDANCYIHLSRKMDTHDISRGRVPKSLPENETSGVRAVLATLPPHALVISIQTDGLFTPSEQRDIADHVPGARLVTIPSPDGHDGFLLEFEQINRHILAFLKERLPVMYEGPAMIDVAQDPSGFSIKMTSTFGEAEADITRW
jgi:homoserine O-acetyltransferase/O-succinyltransferase